MANIKKFNPETQSWETWASSSATGVYSTNPELLPEEEQAITVEDALVRDREDIELMKKNISWLALHGGGGSGGGGGDYNDQIENKIIVYDAAGFESDNIVWRASSKTLRYVVTSSKTSNKFDISISLDGRNIASEKAIAANREMTVNLGTLKKNNTNKHSLVISAKDIYDNAVRKSITITELALSVTGTNANNIYTVDINEIQTTGGLSVNCKSSIPDDYILYWGSKSDLDTNLESRRGYRELTIVSNVDHQVTIPYWSDDLSTRLLVTNDVQIGQTLRFYFILVSKTDPTVISEVQEFSSTITSPDYLAVKPLSLSADVNESTKVSKVGILNCNFVVYLNANSFQYDYDVRVSRLAYDETLGEYIRDLQYPSVFRSGVGKYKEIVPIMYNNLHRDDFFQPGYKYEFEIYAEDRMNRSKNGCGYCYVSIQEAAQTEITLGNEVEESKIFDFNIRNSVPNENWVWTYENPDYRKGTYSRDVITTMTLYNMGGKSKVNTTHCRLTNKAHAIINASTVNGQAVPWFPADSASADSGLIWASGPQFTLSISYLNDFTPDDNRTIFNLGNYVPQTSTSSGYGQGILINNHDFYINLGTTSNLITGKIQDGIYHQIDIVFGRDNNTTDGATDIEVYHNGVLTALGKNVHVADVYTLFSFNEMSIGCRKVNNSKTQYTSLSLQSVSLYGIALNPYQVVCNYINHLIAWDLNENNELNTDLLNEKITSNLIVEKDGDKYACAVWNKEQHSFGTQEWITKEFDVVAPDQTLWSVCPIPIIILDFSNVPQLSWDNFTQSWENITMEPVSVPMYYCLPHNLGYRINGESVLVSIQGTTSKSYAIKNFTIDFGSNRMFWAKENWFPERVYTLKADVVDSAHANNACIGKFVNTCAQNENLLDPTPPMQYFNSNKGSDIFRDLPQVALDEGGLTVKHTLEGFPVLVLASFKEIDESTTNRSLGIYSFNLGREAYHNMGFELLKRFRNLDGTILSNDAMPPILLGAPNTGEDVIFFDAESWEGAISLNCRPKTASTKTQIDAQSGNRYDGSVNAGAPVELNGYFWSSRPSHINHFWLKKYPVGDSDMTKFESLCADMVSMPYRRGSYDTGDGGEVFEYEWDGANMVVPNQTQGGATIHRPNKSCPFNPKNASFYYVVCMLFGLVDSLGKNLNMRLWNRTSADSQWFTCFYDMDTALGIDNIGTQKVDPDVLDESLTNNPEIRRNFIVIDPNEASGNRKMYTVKDNKLWGIIDHSSFKDQMVENAVAGVNSVYANTWNIIRSNYLKSAEDFMNLYFDNQTSGIGEILYNQDFDVKYIHTRQSSFMYGDRKAFVRDWITKRIKFLDGYFGYLQKSNGGNNVYLESTDIEDCSYNNKITVVHQSGDEYLPVVANAPCVLTSTVQNESNQYTYYLPANTVTNVRFANNLGDPGIQTWINNSDLLLEIKYLSDLKVSKMMATHVKTIPSMVGSEDELYSTQMGTLSGFTKFDLSGNKAFDNKAIDFIELFKTWNRGDDTLPYALTQLDLSNTRNDYVTEFALNLTSPLQGVHGEKYYQNPFENLTDINIRNSCVTSVLLPRNIALNTLDVRGSSIQNITLEGQSVLKTVDFSDCIALKSIVLSDCSAFETLVAENLPQLQAIDVSNCPSLSEVRIDLNGSLDPVSIRIDGAENLKKISILNSYSTETYVYIKADHLEELILTGNKFDSVILNHECQGDLKTVNLSSSSVKYINWDGTFTGDYLDLWDCENLVNGGINITNNKVIDKIQLPNLSTPVTINFSFDGCENLTRIYGNLLLTRSAMFKDCTKFTIHGGKFKQLNSNTLYDVKVNGVQYRLGDTASSGCYADIFQEGREVTNLTISTSSASRMFENTSVDAFDVYYALRHLVTTASAGRTVVTNISYMFNTCPKINMKITASVDNSPHWTMFDKCGNITTVEGLFLEDSAMGPFRLYGNHEGEYYNAHKGLFTPLVKCKNFKKVFGTSNTSHANTWFIADKNTFVLKQEGVYFGGTTGTADITDFRPKDVYVDLNQMSAAQVYKAYSAPEDSSLENFERGNIKDFFIGFYRLPSMLSYVMNSMRYLNFGAASDGEENTKMIKLPLEVTNIEYCFSADRTVGTALLQRFFTRNPSTNNFDVTRIVRCFCDNDTTVQNGVWQIDDNALAGFTKLSTFSMVFYGVNKRVVGLQFPYHIFEPCKNTLTNASNFFYGAYVTDGTVPTPIDLPGDLFKQCPNIQNISSCFANFKIPFNLTPNGFENCHKLSNVNNLFDHTTACQNSMPHHFFNTGMDVDNNYTITGTRIASVVLEVPENSSVNWTTTNDYEVVTTTENTRTTRRYRYLDVNDQQEVIYTPLSKYSEQVETLVNGRWQVTTPYGDLQYVRDYEDWEPETEQITRLVPRKSITSMTSPFSDSNILSMPYDNNPEFGGLDYEHWYYEEGDVEPNPDYCPFEYTYENGTWSKAKRNDKTRTFMWAFDGVWTQPLQQFDMSDFELDDQLVETFVNGYGTNFICPPDLLRWCSTSATITGLFSKAHVNGRIPPYLLKPVPDITSAETMFFNPGTLVTYDYHENPGVYITIPPTFFTYATKITNLHDTFAHCTIRSNPQVFDCLKGILNVNGIFYATYWKLPVGTQGRNNKFLLSNVFATNRVSNCKSAFDVSYTEDHGKQYVRFESMFSKDNSKHPANADGKVFYGYYSTDYVEHESPHTCGRSDPTDNQQNYKTLH